MLSCVAVVVSFAHSWVNSEFTASCVPPWKRRGFADATAAQPRGSGVGSAYLRVTSDGCRHHLSYRLYSSSYITIYTRLHKRDPCFQFVMSSDACCTCASLLSSIPPTYDEKSEKPPQHERRTQCCGRAVCARCISDNPRFATYCPFCQVSETPSTLPQGLRDPPPYSPPDSTPTLTRSTRSEDEELPAYNTIDPVMQPSEKSSEPAPDVLHFVNPDQDTIRSLSLRYGVPIDALRRCNGLYSDHLIQARRTVLIPGEYYKGGVSLSPRPVDGEEEEIRKTKVRKWMVSCKCAE